jgi:hypothetical protein
MIRSNTLKTGKRGGHSVSTVVKHVGVVGLRLVAWRVSLPCSGDLTASSGMVRIRGRFEDDLPSVYDVAARASPAVPEMG